MKPRYEQTSKMTIDDLEAALAEVDRGIKSASGNDYPLSYLQEEIEDLLNSYSCNERYHE